jgi:uncharacterized membrane protein
MGHPVHLVLMPFPIALLVAAPITDIVYRPTGVWIEPNSARSGVLGTEFNQYGAAARSGARPSSVC